MDNKRISITQRESVLDALTLAEKGLPAAEICVQLENTAYSASIYLAVNTLELLKKSGRVTPAGAALATLLGLKPVLQIQGGKLDAYAKVRGMANAEKTMLKALEKDLQTRLRAKRCTLRRRTPATSSPRSSGARQYASILMTTALSFTSSPSAFAATSAPA